MAEQTKEYSRLSAPDALRGLIMILMALDHASLFVGQRHSSGEYWGGKLPAYTSSLAFLTRWVTHLCALGFFMLMGIGMSLMAEKKSQRGTPKWQISVQFVIRGILLVALQFLLVNRAWELSSGWVLDHYIGVLSALGINMILGSVMVWLPINWLLGTSLVTLLGFAFLVPSPELWGQIAVDGTLLSNVQLFLGYAGGTTQLWSNYPALPWLPLTLFGLGAGKLLSKNPKLTYKMARWAGVSFLAGFFILRGLNEYGNLHPRPSNDWIGWLNVTKYPPSITFILMTTGINLLLLGLFAYLSNKKTAVLKPLVVFGRVPLFFYLAHLFLYAGLGNWLTPRGTTVAGIYPYWLLGLMILYPLCLGYRKLKRNPRTKVILQYF